MHPKQKFLPAFTLVELIVVITIVGILSTIGFVSYSGYLTGSRDSNRYSQLTKLSDSLQTYAASKSLPLPDDSIDIIASGSTNVIAYQGYVGVDVLETIDYTNGGKDPKDDSYFTYYLTKDRKSMQLLTFMEDAVASHLSQTYAADYEDRTPKTYGKKLGVLVSAEDGTINTPAQEISANTASGYLDVATTTNSYTAIFDTTNSISGTGAQLKVLESIVQEKGFKDSLVVWYDMESMTTNNLKDLSGKGNDAIRIGTEVTAGNANGVFGKSTSFEGLIGGYQMTNTSVLQSNKFSISLWQKTENILGSYTTNVNQYDTIINQWDCTGGPCDDKGGGEWWLGNKRLPDTTTFITTIFGSGSTASLETKEKGIYADSKWHHLALVKSGNEINLYLDGKLSDSVVSKGYKDIGSVLPLYIGTSGHTQTFLNSNSFIDELRIFNTTLDEDEIKRIYQIGKKQL